MKQLKSTRFNLFIVCLFVLNLCCVTFLRAQKKHKIPAEFFTGKWAGELKGYYWSKSDGTINFSIDYDGIQLHGDAILRPLGLTGGGTICVGNKDRPFHVVVEGNKRFYENLLGMVFIFDVGQNPSPNALGLAGLFSIEPLDFSVDLDNSVIKVNHVRTAPDGYWKFTVNGEIQNISRARKTFPKDIKPNEPIKTDKKTQLEITMPSKDVIKIAQNTEAVIRSESLMEIVKGKIHGLIKKLKPKTKFDIHMPTSAVSVRGTEFEINVEDDGTTTVVVLDGEVEFSDKENKKTVIVKKNQMSVCKPKDLPSDPYGINQARLLKWWR